jgi:NAD(P)-dependent dehydrogenase (short-subunit alcohol dehydrogenase family)
MGWLDGKVALIVGGGGGIGRATVDAFVAEGASAAVLEVDKERCRALSGLDAVHAVQGDATEPADVRRAVNETTSRFGRLDTLVTFVGVFDYYTRLDEIPEESLVPAFEEAFAVNVGSCLLAARAALPALGDSGGGIVFTISTSGFYPGRGGPLYVSSKFALRGLVVQLAHELAPGVRVNGVAPGGTMGTELRGLRSLGLENRTLSDNPDREQDLRSNNPLGVALESSDHAGAYVFLASDRARGITGTVINSDGGMGVRA